jgi:hypothetical protein
VGQTDQTVRSKASPIVRKAPNRAGHSRKSPIVAARVRADHSRHKIGMQAEQPYDHPEAIILTAHYICRATATHPPEAGAGASQLVAERYRIDDSTRLFSRTGEWKLTFPREQVALRLKATPMSPGQPSGKRACGLPVLG